MKKKIFVGIICIGVSAIVCGILGSVFFLFARIRDVGAPHLSVPFIFLLISGIGIILHREWGRKIMIGICILGLLIFGAYTCFELYLIISGPSFNPNLYGWIITTTPFFLLLSNIIVLYYLLRPKVKEQFK